MRVMSIARTEGWEGNEREGNEREGEEDGEGGVK